MNITHVGSDLAKGIFQVHGVDALEKVALRKQLKRSQVAEFIAQLARCIIGMEACGGAHFWARRLMELGHTVKLIAPQFVKPFVKTNKTMRPMPKRYVRQSADRTCGLYPLRTSNSKRCLDCTVCGRDLSPRAPHRPIKIANC